MRGGAKRAPMHRKQPAACLPPSVRRHGQQCTQQSHSAGGATAITHGTETTRPEAAISPGMGEVQSEVAIFGLECDSLEATPAAADGGRRTE
ncbi:unnamed protein product [Lampetra fluviatilis]